MNLKNIMFFCLLLFFINCSVDRRLKFVEFKNQSSKMSIYHNSSKNWQNLDIQLDSVPGVSLDRAYNEIIKNRKGQEIIVAVLDTHIDVNHEDLKDAIWTNKSEIENNKIDDDKNGYIDDKNGWNFLGLNNGNTQINSNMEASRIVRNLNMKYKISDEKYYFKSNNKDSLQYIKALEILKKQTERLPQRIQAGKKYIETYKRAFSFIQNILPNKKYSIKELDSILINLKKANNIELSEDIEFAKDAILKNYTLDWYQNLLKAIENEALTTYNPSFNDRTVIGDNENDINDANYGNNDISKQAKVMWHSTQVSGLIAANRENNIGIKGIGNNIKIMPICVSPARGNFNDKDLALGIYYAVNNCAKVINISFSKYSSMNFNMIKDAILYAQKKDVNIIISAGNNGTNLEKEISYPNDYIEFGNEFCNNLIVVGSSTFKTDSNLPSSFSNYSLNNVDVFAPGSDIYTTDAEINYTVSAGTSLSTSIVSGTAALIRSHYPKLTAAQVKQIILDSGVSYDLQVKVPGEKEGVLKPFSEMSKSGKVVNVYNALLMAGEMSKKGIRQKP